MKNLMTLTVFLSLMGSFAEAQSSSKTSLRKKAPLTYDYDPDSFISDVRPFYMLKGFNMGFEYMTTNSHSKDTKFKLTGEVEKAVNGSAEKSTKQIGLKLGYKEVPRGGMGFDINFSVLKEDRRPENTPDVTHLLPSANFLFAAPEYAYISMGLNTQFVVGDEETTYSPRIGYQVGLGTVIGQNFNFEVFYNWINTGLEAEFTQAEIRTTTTSARLIYAF